MTNVKPGQQFGLPWQLLREVCEKEMFICTFVCNGGLFYPSKEGLSRWAVRAELDVFPWEQAIRQTATSELPGGCLVCVWGVVSGVNLYRVSCSYFCISPYRVKIGVFACVGTIL